MALPSHSSSFSYHVFLSFRGEDTRYGFTGHLYKALTDKGFRTFIDDVNLPRGQQITPAIENAIQESRIAIIVLSKHYASSSFCLHELSTIIDCAQSTGLLVIPVFYKVDPSDVRHLRSSYEDVLTKHERRFQHKLQKWKEALRKVADLSGHHFKDGYEYEYKFIGRIVDDVVGLESRVRELMKLLDVGSNNVVHMVGIHEIGGIGKSTLARAVYNLIAEKFDCSCYLGNVGEKSEKHGLEHIQRIILQETLGDGKINVTSVERGASMIAERLQRKKVLLVLDDVDKLEQLQAIVGSREWFGSGSRVIITARDLQLLACHQVKRIYKVDTLNYNDARRLLTWKEKTDSTYEENQLKMARKVNVIKEVNDSKETWKLGVRITDIWMVHRSSKSIMEMIFMDKAGDKIVAQIKNFDIEKWKAKLKEGSSYIVQNFKVETNIGQYKASSHAYKLTFVKGTDVKEQDLPEIPQNVYNFTKFETILNNSVGTDVLIDIIGKFLDIKQWQLRSKPEKVDFTLKDERGCKITCTLWESFALQLKSFLDKHEFGTVIMILHLAQIKQATGKYPVCIRNSKYGSKLIINDNILEINNFNSRLTSQEKFFYNAEVKGLKEFSDVQKDCFCITVATIKKVLVDNGWSFEGCLSCNKKCELTQGQYKCSGCGNITSTTIIRYRLELRVEHESQLAIFILWDHECVQLINQSAIEIKNQMIDEEGEFNPNSIPEALDKVLNKLLAFKVKVIRGSNRFSVSQVCEDEELIKSIVKQIHVDKELPVSDNEKLFSYINKLDDFVESQSVYATTNYDPSLLQHLTPAKRLSSNSQFDDVTCEDLPSAQLSSTKLSKQIRIE